MRAWADDDGEQGVLATAAALRWARPDLTSALARHVLDVAFASGDRDRWLAGAGWAVHAHAATGDGRGIASDLLAGLPRWGSGTLDVPAAHRLRVDLAVVAVGTGEVPTARLLLAPVLDGDGTPELRADAYCALARCTVEDAAEQVEDAVQQAQDQWARVGGRRGQIGSASVALVEAVGHRRAGRPDEAVDRSAAGLARLERCGGSAPSGTPSGHVAAALTAEWLTSLLAAGRLEEARQGCIPLLPLLAEPIRPSRQMAGLRLAVAWAVADSAGPDRVAVSLAHAAQDAADSDARDLEAVCLSALSAVHEKEGRSAEALEARQRTIVARRQDGARAARFRAVLATQRVLAPAMAATADTAAAAVRGPAGRTPETALGRAGDRPAGRRRAPEVDPAPAAATAEARDAVTGRFTRPGSVAGAAEAAPAAEVPTTADVVTPPAESAAGPAAPGAVADAGADAGGPQWSAESARVSDGSGAGHGPAPVADGGADPGADGDEADLGGWAVSWADEHAGDSPIGELLARSMRSGRGAARDSASGGPPAADDAPRPAPAGDPATAAPADRAGPCDIASDHGSPTEVAAAPVRADIPGARDAGGTGEVGGPADPWLTGEWSRTPVEAPELGNADLAEERVDPAPEEGAADRGRSDDRWTEWQPHAALAEIDRAWGRSPEEQPVSGTPAKAGAAGCVVAVDICRDGRRFAGRRAAAVVGAAADRLGERLPAGARLRHDDTGVLSVVLAGWERAAATAWMHRTLPGLLDGYVAECDLQGMALRAAVHDTDGRAGAQLLQRLDHTTVRSRGARSAALESSAVPARAATRDGAGAPTPAADCPSSGSTLARPARRERTTGAGQDPAVLPVTRGAPDGPAAGGDGPVSDARTSKDPATDDPAHDVARAAEVDDPGRGSGDDQHHTASAEPVPTVDRPGGDIPGGDDMSDGQGGGRNGSGARAAGHRRPDRAAARAGVNGAGGSPDADSPGLADTAEDSSAVPTGRHGRAGRTPFRIEGVRPGSGGRRYRPEPQRPAPPQPDPPAPGPVSSLGPPSSSGAATRPDPAPVPRGPATAASAAAGPDASGPDASGPDASGPDAARPDAAGPDASGPVAAGPDAAGPDASGSVASGSVASGPAASGSGAVGPGTAGPGSATPGSAIPGPGAAAPGPTPPGPVVRTPGAADPGGPVPADRPPTASVPVDPATTGTASRGTGTGRPDADGLGLADLLAEALAAYRGI